MPRIPELDIAKRAVTEGIVPEGVLQECLSEKRKARADGLELSLRELLQEKGVLSAQGWEALERRANVAATHAGSGPATPAPPERGRHTVESTVPRPRESSRKTERSRPAAELEPTETRAPEVPERLQTASGRLVPSAEVLGDYRIVRELGRGAMGVVYEAIQTTLNRRVALKVLPAGSALSAVARERFVREARAAASLAHPGIVPIYDQGEERGVPFFAMELIRGRTLKQVLAKAGPLAPRRAAKLAAQAARALDYAHERGVIHRDVKPDNFFLVEAEGEREERLLLADFGLATRLEDTSLTREGTVVGTPLYMAPEQARGERDRVDRRTDVYGLGATLYELLSGTPPFDGSPDTQVLLTRIRDEDPTPVRVRARRIGRPGQDSTRKGRTSTSPGEPAILDVPPALDAIVGRTLEKDLDRRYTTAALLADDLERFLRGDPVLAKPPSAAEKLARFARRRAGLLAGVGAVATFAVVAVALAIPTQRRWSAEALVLRAGNAKTPPDEARRLVEEALRLVPTHAEARTRLAALILAEGDANGARAQIERALQDDDRCLEARLLRAELLRKAGNVDAAWVDLEVARDVGRDDPRVAYARGAVLLERNKPAEAAAELDRGLERARAARVRGADDAGYREATRLAGEAKFRAGDFAGAQQDLEEAIRFDPNGVGPRVLLGRALVAQGQDALAIEAFSDALRRAPGDPDALEQRAAARRRAGRAGEAFHDLVEAGNRPRARLLRGLLVSETLDHSPDAREFDYKRARADLLAALGLSGEDRAGGPPLDESERVRGLVALAWVELALGEPTEARVARAVERIEAALQVAPRDLATRLARGLLLVRAGRASEARGDLEAARAHPPLAYSATFGLAKVALAERRERDALALLQVACELAPARPAARALRARLLAEAGDLARARDERKLALATLGAEAARRGEDGVGRTPLHDVGDPLEAAERAAIRGIEAFDAAVRADPGRSASWSIPLERASAWLRRAWLLDPDRGHVVAKLAHVRYLMGDVGTAWNAYAVGKALDPLLLEADVMHGVLERDFQVGGGTKNAPRTLERATEAASRPAPDGDPELAGRAWFELARAYDEVGDAEKALAAVQEACRRTPERHAPIALRARILTRAKHPDARAASRAASALLHKAVGSAEASRSQVYERAGEYCEDVNDLRAALHFFTRAIESDPSNPQAWKRRGMRLFKAAPHEFPQAFLDVTTAIELDPELANHFHDVERSLLKFRQFSDEFQDRVNEIVRAAPDLASAQFVGGFWELFRGQPATARARFDEAVEFAPEWYLPWAYRACARLRLDDLDGAEKDLAEARRLWAKDGVVPFFEAALALKRGDKDGCYRKLQEALQLDFRYGEIYRNSPDLVSLAGEPRFEKIVEDAGGDDEPWNLRPRSKKKKN